MRPSSAAAIPLLLEIRCFGARKSAASESSAGSAAKQRNIVEVSSSKATE
jgi:hypothetical protein